MIRYHVIGGGCYGTFYVKQLIEGRSRGKVEWDEIIVLDRDPECAAFLQFEGQITQWVGNWEDYGVEVIGDEGAFSNDHLVPAPIAPHILLFWSKAVMESVGLGFRTARFDGTLPTIPYASVLDSGGVVLSHAPGLCPTHCTEPGTCPLTKGPRTWDMPETVAELSNRSLRFVCRHFAYGVGTILFKDILSEFARIDGFSIGEKVAVATTSGCHGLVDFLEVCAVTGTKSDDDRV